MRAFPQYGLDDYLYKLSIAQIQFLAIDNTHTKYLKGSDKKAWNGYKEAYEAQQKLDNFIGGLKMPKDIKKLKKGEVMDIPINKKNKKANK